MGLKLVVTACLALLCIIWGAVWYRKSANSTEPYDFKADLKHTFLTPHRRYGAHNNMDARYPRKILPLILVLGGIFMLVVGVIKIA